MSPRRGPSAARGRSLTALGLGLLAGLGITMLGQACFPGCEDVETLRFIGGRHERTDSWGEIAPHAIEDDVLIRLDIHQRVLRAEFDTPTGHIVEVWELEPTEGW